MSVDLMNVSDACYNNNNNYRMCLDYPLTFVCVFFSRNIYFVVVIVVVFQLLALCTERNYLEFRSACHSYCIGKRNALILILIVPS